MDTSKSERDEYVDTETDVVFEADENDGLTAYTFADRVKGRLNDLGVGQYQRPRLERDHEGVVPGLSAGQYFDGRLPTVIRKLSLDQLSALYSLYSNWFGYLTSQTMLIAAERSEAIRQKEFLFNHLKNYYRRPLRSSGKRTPETAVSDAAKTDKRFVTANARYEELNALYSILEAMREVAAQDMKVISREVTIQQEKIHQNLLLHGMGNRGKALDAEIGESSYATTDDTPPEPSTPQRRVHPKLPTIRRPTP